MNEIKKLTQALEAAYRLIERLLKENRKLKEQLTDELRRNC